jgi:hypothetical protein
MSERSTGAASGLLLVALGVNELASGDLRILLLGLVAAGLLLVIGLLR